MKRFIPAIIWMCLFCIPTRACSSNDIITSSECAQSGGEIINTLTEEGCKSESEFLGEVSGLRCPCICCKFLGNDSRMIPKKIEIPDKLRVRDSFIKNQYYGVIQNQKELKEIWSKLYDIHNDFNIITNTNDSPVPEIDFNHYSVIWYANRGSGASFVESIRIMEEPQDLKIKIRVFYSDFGSSHLNLWKVSKISKEIVFEEVKRFETMGP